MLVGSDKWKEIKEALPCWTGTMAAYEKPGKALGKTVEREDAGLTWIFPVPAKFQGEKDACLSVDHPHFTVKVDGKKRTIIVDDEANVTLTKDFPAENGWHKTDANGIPCSDKLNEDHPNARYLYRADRMVGPVARYLWRYVVLDFAPSERLGVVVEGKPADEAGTPEKLAMEREAGRLILTGSDEQLEKAAKLLEKLNLE
jgi:hypothetical protein